MALSLVTTAVTLFYLGAIPLQIAFRFRSGAGFGMGIAPFEARFALRRVRSRGMKKHTIPPSIDKTAALRALLHAGQYALRHLKFERIDLHGTFGCDDAALTALVCGGVNALGTTLRPISRRILLNLRPDFSSAHLTADLSGMICVRIGHIIFAALLGVIEYSAGRLKPWTDTPSKAL